MYNIYAFHPSNARNCRTLCIVHFSFSVGQCQDQLSNCPDYANLCGYDNVQEQCPLTCTLCGKFTTKTDLRWPAKVQLQHISALLLGYVNISTFLDLCSNDTVNPQFRCLIEGGSKSGPNALLDLEKKYLTGYQGTMKLRLS